MRYHARSLLLASGVLAASTAAAVAAEAEFQVTTATPSRRNAARAMFSAGACRPGAPGPHGPNHRFTPMLRVA